MAFLNTSQLTPPLPVEPDVVTCSIRIEGEEISDNVQIKSIVIDRRLNRISSAHVIVLDSGVSVQRLETSDQEIFTPGKNIEIYAGYSSDESLLFKGIIIRHGIKIKNGKSAVLDILCKDIAVKMTVGRKNRYFKNLSDKDIVNQIINSEYNQLALEMDDTNIKHIGMVQYFATDWDFIVTRAEANALLIHSKDGKLIIKKPDFDQDEKFVLNYGTSIFDFEAEMDARDQYPAARSVSWDISSQELKVAESSSSGTGINSGRGSFRNLSNIDISQSQNSLTNTDYSDVSGISHYLKQHSGNLSNEELQAWAESQYQKSKLSKSKGYVRFEGVADIYPDECINLQNVGLRHSGKIYVTAVRQEIHEGRWFTKAQFGLPHNWFGEQFDNVTDRPAANLVPGTNGLQIGLVTKIDNDPQGEDRILVRLPLVDIAAEGIWARIASQDAGSGDANGRGAFFRPEIDDEVIVGFINDDPREAIVLGMLNSSSKPAPIIAAEDNNEKGWVTRSGIKALFNDEDKSFTIETPGGKKMKVDDQNDIIQFEDQNNNTVKLSGEGIYVESGADIKIKAQGDIQIEGLNIKGKAQAALGFEATATAELKSTADVVINGSFVRIN